MCLLQHICRNKELHIVPGPKFLRCVTGPYTDICTCIYVHIQTIHQGILIKLCVLKLAEHSHDPSCTLCNSIKDIFVQCSLAIPQKFKNCIMESLQCNYSMFGRGNSRGFKGFHWILLLLLTSFVIQKKHNKKIFFISTAISLENAIQVQ